LARSVRTVNPLLTEHPSAVNMVLDILFERGFTVVLDVQITSVPFRVCQSTGLVTPQAQRVHLLQITWPKPAVRAESHRH
jgi:hypothetical protein